MGDFLFIRIFINMNLQENIQRIRSMMGVDNKTTGRRLLYIADEHLDNLNPKGVCDYWSEYDGIPYVNETIGEITILMTDKIFEIRNYGDPHGEEWADSSEEWKKIHDVIYDLLIELDYDGKVREFFYDAISNCK